MSEFKPLTFPKVSRNGKTMLCNLGQYVYDPTRTNRDFLITNAQREEAAEETKKLIEYVMAPWPRRL